MNVSVFHLPKHNNIFQKCEKYKDDTSTHPDVECRNIADPRCVLPHRTEHSRKGKEGGHGHGHPAGYCLGWEEEGQPGYYDKQT